MSDTKMLQAILNGQAALREHITNEVTVTRSDLKNDISRLEKKVDENTERINKIGQQLAYLEDDTPAREDFDALENRMTKVESKLTS